MTADVRLTPAEAGLVVSALYALINANEYMSRYRENVMQETVDAERLLARITEHFRLEP